METQKSKVESQEESDIPEWHIRLVRKRIEDYLAHPEEAIDFDTVMDDIEKDL